MKNSTDSEQNEEQKKIKMLESAVEHYHKICQRWISTAHLWEGKFHQVKRENNALRRKLYPNK